MCRRQSALPLSDTRSCARLPPASGRRSLFARCATVTSSSWTPHSAGTDKPPGSLPAGSGVAQPELGLQAHVGNRCRTGRGRLHELHEQLYIRCTRRHGHTAPATNASGRRASCPRQHARWPPPPQPTRGLHGRRVRSGPYRDRGRAPRPPARHDERRPHRRGQSGHRVHQRRGPPRRQRLRPSAQLVHGCCPPAVRLSISRRSCRTPSIDSTVSPGCSACTPCWPSRTSSGTRSVS